MRAAAIDDLVFQAAPLGERPAVWPPSLSVDISTGTAHRGFTQQVPLFARRPPMAYTDANWPAYCGLLKDLGIPLQTTVEPLESLSVVNVPMRFARRAFDEGFNAVELETAEVIEISCHRQLDGEHVPHFPLEISAWHELKLLIDTVRDVSSARTPIGLGIVTGDINTDMANALAARADFVILELPTTTTAGLNTNQLDSMLWSVVAARTACRQVGAPAFPIYIDAPLSSPDHLIKLLALGATAVSIDALARTSLPPPPVADVAPKGLLSGIGALPTKALPPNVAPLERQLTELITQLKARLHQQQLSSVGELSAQHLRALSQSAARLAGVQLLQH